MVRQEGGAKAVQTLCRVSSLWVWVCYGGWGVFSSRRTLPCPNAALTPGKFPAAPWDGWEPGSSQRTAPTTPLRSPFPPPHADTSCSSQLLPADLPVLGHGWLPQCLSPRHTPRPSQAPPSPSLLWFTLKHPTPTMPKPTGCRHQPARTPQTLRHPPPQRYHHPQLFPA